MSKHRSPYYGYDGYNIYAIARARSCNYIYCVQTPFTKSYMLKIFTDQDNASICYKEHPELLSKAVTVYVHKKCTVPRIVIKNKFKIVNDPFIADAVIVPLDPPDSHSFSSIDCAPDYRSLLAVDTMHKILIQIPVDIVMSLKSDQYDLKDINEVVKGQDIRLGDLISNINFNPETCKVFYTNGTSSALTKEWVVNCKVIGCKNVLYVKDTLDWVIDCMEGTIPENKIVFEHSALSYIDDDISLEYLQSMYLMLIGEDYDAAKTAFKALSVSSYTQHLESVKFILSHCDAKVLDNLYRDCRSVTEQYMKKILHLGIHSSITFRETSISRKDWDTLKRFMLNNNFYTLKYLKGMAFINVDPFTDRLVPILKDQPILNSLSCLSIVYAFVQVGSIFSLHLIL